MLVFFDAYIFCKVNHFFGFQCIFQAYRIKTSVFIYRIIAETNLSYNNEKCAS